MTSVVRMLRHACFDRLRDRAWQVRYPSDPLDFPSCSMIISACTTSVGHGGRVRDDQYAFSVARRSSFLPDPLAGRENQAVIYELGEQEGHSDLNR